MSHAEVLERRLQYKYTGMPLNPGRIHLCENCALRGSEFLRKLKKLGRRRGVAVSLDPQHGDGSHGRVYYGAAFTTLKDRKKEIGRGLLHEMCSELGIGEKDLEGR